MPVELCLDVYENSCVFLCTWVCGYVCLVRLFFHFDGAAAGFQGSRGVPRRGSRNRRGAGPGSTPSAEASLSSSSEGYPPAAVSVASGAGAAPAELLAANGREHEDPGSVEDASVMWIRADFVVFVFALLFHFDCAC